jgi:hypothetical protein
VTENTPSVRDVDCSGDNIDIFEVEVTTTPPDSFGCVDNCGIVDLPQANYTRMTATAVMYQDIFAKAFSDEWTEPEPESQAHTVVMDQTIW